MVDSSQRGAALALCMSMLVLPPAAAAVDCACKVFPFTPDPPCFQQCTAILIAEGDLDRLQSVLELPDELRRSLAEAISTNRKPDELSDLEGPLTRDQYLNLERRLRRMSEREFDAVRSTAPSLR